MAHPEKRVKATDFMPSQWRRQKPERPRSRAVIAQECRNLMQSLMERNKPR